MERILMIGETARTAGDPGDVYEIWQEPEANRQYVVRSRPKDRMGLSFEESRHTTLAAARRAAEAACNVLYR